MKITLLALFSLFLLAVLPFFGYIEMPFSKIFGESAAANIFWNIRVPRTSGAFVCGATLALCGMVFQSMFKNDLATPYTLGVSSGAAMGAVLAIKLFSGIDFAIPVTQILSFACAFLTVVFIYSAGRLKKRFDTGFLLLAGVAVNFICSGLILFIQYIASGSESAMMIHWMMGSLDFTGFATVLKVVPAFLVMIFVSLFFHRELDLMRIDSDIAATRGVNMNAVGNILLFTVSLSVAVVVSQVGPVGFIGMVAPHIAGKIVGRRHGSLAFASLFAGGSILMLSDAVSRTVIAPSEIPAGVVTSLIGGPFFLFILIKSK
ncbi:iron ABC transporter permease [bacterium]|nr:iron ABC transporter permease [bacterium]